MSLRASLLHDTLPSDATVVTLTAHEGVSVLFDIDVTFLCDDPDVDLDALLGSTALVAIDDDAGTDPIRWHGAIEESEFLYARDLKFAYRVRLRPLVHGLAYRVRSRTFQDLDAVEIVKAVLHDAGIPTAATAWHTTGVYPKRTFCLQYKESELAFVLRLLEDEGIYYTFEHTDAGHTMVFLDAVSSHAPIEGDATLGFVVAAQGDREGVTDLTFQTQITPGSYVARDWNFEQPANPLEAEQQVEATSGLQVYDYPAGFRETRDGGRRALNRLQALTVTRVEIEGVTHCRRLLPERTFTLVDARPDFLARDYLLLEVHHAYTEPEHAAGHQANVSTVYQARFRAIPSDVPFRPARTTPRPRVWGKESAVVTGPAGEEIHVDAAGRIKVHFYWDREGHVDDTASFWIRVQQQNTSGSMILPRVGWEVDVGFVNGDPDRPVVMQKLYNTETMPPYGLPDNKTQGALQSSSSPGGGNTNEVRMQDGHGGMEFFVHAAKDFAADAGADRSEHVAVDAKEEVGLTFGSTVGASESVSIGAKQSVSVTGNCTRATGGSKSVTVSATDDWGIGGNFAITCDGGRTETIGSMMNVLANHVAEAFNGSCTRTVGAAQCINSATAIVETVGGSKTERVGGAKIELVRNAKQETIAGSKTLTCGLMTVKSGKDVGMSAKAAMSITAGGAIAEDVSGDFAFGAKGVLITAAGGVTMKAGGSSLDAKGGKITVNASSLGASGGPLVKLKGNINYKP